MAQQQQLSYAAIQKLESDIQHTTQSMAKQVQKLADMLAQLQADWKGLGATAFTKAQQDLNDDHAALRKVLEDIQVAVHDTKIGSHANDQKVLDDMKRINVTAPSAITAY